MKTTHIKNMELNHRFSHKGIDISLNYINTLRRAEMTLHRWAELECGDGNNYASWAIERDEQTGKPYFVTYHHDGRTSKRLIADREKGALKRIAYICKELGLHFFHQGDPRGCQLYISREPLNNQNYNSGIAVSVA